MNLYKFLFLFILFINIINCTENTKYSGKNINKLDIDYSKLNNKSEIVKILGIPSYIDPIEKKYFYYSEEKISKNFFNQKISKRDILVFEFDIEDKLLSYKKKSLEDFNEIKFNKDKTPNIFIKRGIIEKVFGGVGKSVPTTP